MTRGEVLEHTEGWRWLRARAAPVYYLMSAVLAGVFGAQDYGHPIWFLWLAYLAVFANGTVRSLMKLVVIVQVKAEWEADKPTAGSQR